ncbi:winged-helix domain-containing protein, partial [Methanobacterium formicicum]
MPQETDRKMMEILRILADRSEVLGAKTIAEELRKKGYDLGERAVRYHMRILDEKGFTERIGYAGRRITSEGIKELEKGLIYDQVDFIFAKFE